MNEPGAVEREMMSLAEPCGTAMHVSFNDGDTSRLLLAAHDDADARLTEELERLRGADVEAGLAQVALKEVQAQLAERDTAAAEVIAQLVEALEAYLGWLTTETLEAAALLEIESDDATPFDPILRGMVSALAAARAWQEHSKEAPCSSSSSP